MELKKRLKSSLVRLVPLPLRWEIEKSFPFLVNPKHELSRYLNLSFSQEGEDLLLQRLIGNKPSGFYVDIGAHHPFRFSNTYRFYLQGWRGINVDPLPGSMDLFNEKRPRDINLEMAVLNCESDGMTYYMFEEPAYNGFNNEIVRSRNEKATSRLIGTKTISSKRLATILAGHLPTGIEIDFLSIDVEGMEMDVLKSNDWKKYRPNFVVLESLDTTLEDDLNAEASIYLRERDYRLVSKTMYSLFFQTLRARPLL